MRKFESFPSPVKLAGVFLLLLAAFMIFAFFTTVPVAKAQQIGWFGIVVLGLAMLALPFQLFRTSRPEIVMDDAGIHTGSLFGLINWDDVTGFRVDAIHGVKFLSIFVKDQQKYLERMPAIARSSAMRNPQLGFSEITLNFAGLSPGIEDACWFLGEIGYKVEESG